MLSAFSFPMVSNGTNKFAGLLFTMSHYCLTSNRKAINTNFEVIGLTGPEIEPILVVSICNLPSHEINNKEESTTYSKQVCAKARKH